MALTANVTGLPEKARGPFQRLAHVAAEVTGENLLELAAFGGWLIGDPLYQGTPARSVLVLRQFDVQLLARFAEHGARLGGQGLEAPLVMTPAYIAASCDVFPLELLEIQQMSVVVVGTGHFAGLRCEAGHVRLQCEREVKSGLIHLRQGLLASAGKYKQLDGLCKSEAERAVRVLRGVLQMGGTPVQRMSTEMATQAAATTGLRLDALRQVLAGAQIRELAAFEPFYDEIAGLAQYVDRLGLGKPGGTENAAD